MIFVGGASGTGKTTALERFTSRYPDFCHLRASSILRDFGRPVSMISLEDLIENQRILRAFLLQKRPSSKTLLDGHMTIPLGDQVFHVPTSFFKDIALTAFVFMKTDPMLLLHRKGASANSSTFAELETLQRVEYEQMQMVGAEYDCPVYVVNPSDDATVERVLLKSRAV